VDALMRLQLPSGVDIEIKALGATLKKLCQIQRPAGGVYDSNVEVSVGVGGSACYWRFTPYTSSN